MRLAALHAWIRKTLLPPVLPPGAMPIYSLSYLAMLFFPLLVPRFPETNWGATLLSLVLFLPLYFGQYWLRGWRRIGALFAMVALSLALLPANALSNTYVIYATILSAHLRRSEMLLVFAVGQLSFVAAVHALGGPALMLGAINLVSGGLAMFGCRFWYENARKNEALRLSQDEVQRIAAVAERERIGRDLHDLLGHTLSVIALKSELAAKLIDRDVSAARAEIQEVERVTRQALFEVRRAVSGMRAHGLMAEFANGRMALDAAQVQFEYSAPSRDWPAATEGVLAMALREAVTNIIRHAQARRCSARLSCDGAMAVLDVEDDGVGGVRAEGNGLVGMRERVEAAGGRLRIDSPKDAGTRLRIELPIPPDGDEPARPAARSLKLVASR